MSGEGGVWVTRGAVPRVAAEDGGVVLLPLSSPVHQLPPQLVSRVAGAAVS